MKKALSLIAATAVLGTVSAFSADSLSEAFENGSVNGDIALTYENRDKKGGDSAYSVASTGLNFETDKLKNFSVGIGFRGYGVLWEQENGNSQGWIETDEASAIVANTFLAYTTDAVNVKIGRQSFRTEWMTDDFDAIKADITPFEKAQLELIYATRSGDITAREYYAFTNLGDDGMYKVGFTYAFSDAISAKAYYMDMPDIKDMYGVRADFYTTASDVEIGGYAHYMGVNDDFVVNEGTMIDTQLYVGLSGWYGYAGYTDNKDAGLGRASYVDASTWGGYHGDTAVYGFEEGDQMYNTSGDNSTWYAMLYKNFGGVDFTIVYGETDYNWGAEADPVHGLLDFSKGEFNIWAGYAFRDDFRADLGIMRTTEDDADSWTEDVTQVNMTFTYTY